MQPAENLPPVPDLQTAWRQPVGLWVCDSCDRSFLLPELMAPAADRQSPLCPTCFSANLSLVLDPSGLLEFSRPPELLLPFGLDEARLPALYDAFARRIPYPPGDLTPASLARRLQRLYLPMWLVDVDVQATWRCEAGYNYQVVSHQDRYEQNRGQWATRQVEETRVRWEPRLGELRRTYPNLAAPALRDDQALRRTLGEFDLRRSQPYSGLPGGYVRLPDRSTSDAWSDARHSLQGLAAEECRQAIGADHHRQFTWQPDFSRQNWTLLLLPVFTTCYLDDAGQPQVVYIHGQSGKLHGSRRASMRKAQSVAVIILVIAAVLFGLGLLLAALGALFPVLLPLGGIGLVLAALVACAAAVPVVQVWAFNRT